MGTSPGRDDAHTYVRGVESPRPQATYATQPSRGSDERDGDTTAAARVAGCHADRSIARVHRRDRGGHAGGTRHPRGDGVHDDRRYAGDHGALHDPDPDRRVRGARFVTSPRRGRRLRVCGDHGRRHRGSRSDRLAALRLDRGHRGDRDRSLPAAGSCRATGVPRRLPVEERADRLPDRGGHPGGDGAGGRHVRRAGRQRWRADPGVHRDAQPDPVPGELDDGRRLRVGVHRDPGAEGHLDPRSRGR